MPEMAPPPADPGWRSAWRAGPALILPQFAMRKARTEPNVIIGMRTVYLSFALLVGVVGVIGAVLLAVGGGGATSVSVAQAILGVVVIGGLAIFAQVRTGARSIKGDDTITVVGEYYKRILRRCALAAVILPWAIIGGVFALSALPLVVGLVLSAISLWLMFPGEERLLSERRSLAASGSPVDLIVALSTRGEAGGPTAPPRPKGDGGPNRPGPTKRTAGGGSGSSAKKRKKR